MEEKPTKERYELLSEIVKVAVLGWSAALLTLSYMGFFQKMVSVGGEDGRTEHKVLTVVQKCEVKRRPFIRNSSSETQNVDHPSEMRPKMHTVEHKRELGTRRT